MDFLCCSSFTLSKMNDLINERVVVHFISEPVYVSSCLIWAVPTPGGKVAAKRAQQLISKCVCLMFGVEQVVQSGYTRPFCSSLCWAVLPAAAGNNLVRGVRVDGNITSAFKWRPLPTPVLHLLLFTIIKSDSGARSRRRTKLLQGCTCAPLLPVFSREFLITYKRPGCLPKARR